MENQLETLPIESNKEIAEKKEENPALEAYRGQYKIAMQYAKSDLVPPIFKGKPENVIIAMGLSEKIGIDLFTIMQNLTIVKGKIGWTGSFCKVLIERTRKYKDIEYVFVGEKGKDDYGCYLQATQKSNGKVVKGTVVDMAMVKAENWISNPKWKSMPQQMLSYRAASFFARLYCPEALSGIYTQEENEDITQEVQEIQDVLVEENKNE